MKWLVPTMSIAIFFLTGCARTEYHKTLQHPPLSREAVYAFEPGVTPDFEWPAEGRVIVSYGERQAGSPAKGWTVETRPDMTVAASEAGKIGFVDPSLDGYGSTVVVEHSKDFATVYAGLSDIRVRPGQILRKGDVLGRVAAHGTAGRYYFEIRRHTRAEDPQIYLTR